MGEIAKYMGQLALQHLPFTILFVLFLLSGFFKLTKREVDPLGSLINWVGKHLNDKVSKEVEDLKTSTDEQFKQIKKDRTDKVDELKKDYNKQISGLKTDLDSFKAETTISICQIKDGTSDNCQKLQERLNDIEKSNDLQTAARIRVHVLNFAADLREGKPKTEEEYDVITEESETYDAIVKKYKLKNNKFKNAIEFINEKNKECMRNGYATYENHK